MLYSQTKRDVLSDQAEATGRSSESTLRQAEATGILGQFHGQLGLKLRPRLRPGDHKQKVPVPRGFVHPCLGNSTIHPSFYAFHIAPQPTPHQSLAKDFPHPAFASLFLANTSWSLVIASRGKVAVAEWAVSGTLEMDLMETGGAKWRMGMGMQPEKGLVVVGERSWGAFLDGVARVIGSGEVIGVEAVGRQENEEEGRVL
ncbi:hypothetical protein BDZ91DRAFT_765174 [Kalaharituber pfeilii]|nr:hypothetical protein BDZ91DRAFT_765174 [Kalaharituber pfeilii]